MWHRQKLWSSRSERLDLKKNPATYGHMHIKLGKIIKPFESHFPFRQSKNVTTDAAITQ